MSRSIHTTLRSFMAHRGKKEIDVAVKTGDADLEELVKKRQYKRKTHASRAQRVPRRPKT